MTQGLSDSATDARREDWIKRVQIVLDQISTWSRNEGWTVTDGNKTIREPVLGMYEVPALAIRLPGGELLVNPIALNNVGGNGRLDIEALPTLNRVKLIGNDEGTWTVMTDSNVPLRMPWDAPSFVQLAHDLLA